MKESVTYQAILEEGLTEGKIKGKIEEARSILLCKEAAVSVRHPRKRWPPSTP